jgi:hypothetical protein
MARHTLPEAHPRCKNREAYIEKNKGANGPVSQHGVTVYAKVGPRNGRRIYREKSTARYSRPQAHPICKRWVTGGRINGENTVTNGPAYKTISSSTIQSWIPKTEEEYIEKNAGTNGLAHTLMGRDRM